jgi:hypothetical protein
MSPSEIEKFVDILFKKPAGLPALSPEEIEATKPAYHGITVITKIVALENCLKADGCDQDILRCYAMKQYLSDAIWDPRLERLGNKGRSRWGNAQDMAVAELRGGRGHLDILTKRKSKKDRSLSLIDRELAQQKLKELQNELVNMTSCAADIQALTDLAEDPWARTITDMIDSIKGAVSGSNREVVRLTKNKELRLTPAELETLLSEMLVRQDYCCALTGISMVSHGNSNLRPSADRIDSNGHYEATNLQIVCRFINFWKRDQDNDECKRLIALVRQGGG